MNNEHSAEVGGFQFLDSVVAGPRKLRQVVAAQKELYTSADQPGWIYYGDLYTGLKAAVNSVDPSGTLDKVVRKAAEANDARGLAFREASDGFLKLMSKGATGVPVKTARWTDGDLTVVMRRMIGLRQKNGTVLYVAPYVKCEPLDQDGADVLLYLMESVLDQALPGATPVVWDVRRGKAFKLRKNTNRVALDHYVRAQARAYMYMWNAA
ncbi:hypothetical protein [Amycolatopsis sp. VC5-11]|uniref:hypothetical protein n=1 Tax=Amycolatopsis sp. VC5-11 TaxID=3120156 RepID=UPI00300AA9CF